MYPDPQSFKPERFLLNGKLNPAIRDPETAAFGFGRRSAHCIQRRASRIELTYNKCRICPGRHMATSSLWITIASILSTLHISKAIGEDGKVVEPTYEYFPGTVL